MKQTGNSNQVAIVRRATPTVPIGDLALYTADGGLPEHERDQEGTGKCDPDSRRPKVGEPFIPYRRFYVLPIPDLLLQSHELPAGAKLVYGRLCRHVGKK
jgi:hypothetical protein